MFLMHRYVSLPTYNMYLLLYEYQMKHLIISKLVKHRLCALKKYIMLQGKKHSLLHYIYDLRKIQF
jgi:hypothetical protein